MKYSMKKATLLLFPFALAACSDYTDDYPVPPGSVVASFTYSSATGFSAPDTIQFVNTSIVPEDIAGEVSFVWDFGDGQTSVEANPVHIFTIEDTFRVTLTPVAEVANRLLGKTEEIFIRQLVEVDTLFYENFDGLQVFPSDWVLVNSDGLTPDNPAIASLKDSAFIVTPSTFFKGSIAMGVSFYNPEGGADDWMILPAIELGDSSELRWEAMSLTTTGNYPDDYQIRVSTTTQDVPGCLANPILFRVNDEEWRETATAIPGKGIQKRKISLKRYAGQTVYIAFRLVTPTPGGDRIAFDEITVIEP